MEINGRLTPAILPALFLPSSTCQASLRTPPESGYLQSSQSTQQGQELERCRQDTAAVMPPNTRDNGSPLTKTSSAKVGASPRRRLQDDHGI